VPGINCKNSLIKSNNNSLRKSIAQCGGNLQLQFNDMISVAKFKSVIQVLDYFKDEAFCKKYVEQQRWKGVITCPHCGYTHKIYHTKRGYKCGNPECYKKFSVLVGTMMEDTKIKLRYWFAAFYLLSAHKRGISSYQLASDLGITQKSAWHLSHRIRKMLVQRAPEKIKVLAQSDESFVGGKNKNRHADKKVKNSQGRSFKDKTPVLGILEPGEISQIRTIAIPDTQADTLQPLLEENIEKGAILMTDEWKGYSEAHTAFDHKFVNHGAKEYVNGAVTTNGVENFWSHFKRGIIGVYYHVSRKHLQRYCDEFTYRFNSRDSTACERFEQLISRVEGRLTWKTLVHG